jgi:DNA-binding transcriptional regulator YhcF (GntR family)
MEKMNNKGKKRTTAPEMPFQVDRKLNVDIPTQVTDGIRAAILSGFYKPGDFLPKATEFTRGLHVSLRAPLAAYRTLKKEGLISPRRRLGTVVVGPKADVFHGRVVIVNQNSNPYYSDAVTNEVLTRRLAAAGYVVVSVSAIPLGGPRGNPDKERFDVRQLNAALRQNTSLAVIMGTVPPLERAVAAAGTPYFVAGKPHFATGAGKPGTPGCIGFASAGAGGALPGVLERLRKRNVRSLVQIGIRQTDLMDAEALRGVCESYDEWTGWPRHLKYAKQEDIVRAAYDLFRARYRTKADLPGAFLFTDDYLARGALLALVAAGIRTGRDVLAITLANKGNVPVHSDPIDLILCDPAREADVIADALVAYLDTGTAPGTITLENAFVAGEG